MQVDLSVQFPLLWALRRKPYPPPLSVMQPLRHSGKIYEEGPGGDLRAEEVPNIHYTGPIIALVKELALTIS
ncbi:hypothetical protein INT43_002768 [Umbelopsis isabellina]|uniref:Uncharacterized protein n=1 Tax=Mortierella isabellina TaxID=91625 RepID=A0A8H7Q6Q4_MORIS|nr:hypothetical protein INT43_002768 [Umbelopsis isabellina]